MSDGLKILLGALGGAIATLLLASVLGRGGIMGSMMGGGLFGGLFALLFWVLVVAPVVALVVWVLGQTQRR